MSSLFLLFSCINFRIIGDSHILLHSTPQLVYFQEIFTLFGSSPSNLLKYYPTTTIPTLTVLIHLIQSWICPQSISLTLYSYSFLPFNPTIIFVFVSQSHTSPNSHSILHYFSIICQTHSKS